MSPKIVLSLIALLPACTTEGFRADGGGCPAGEVCSPETPNGLRFSGSRFSGDWWFANPGIKMMAEGGTQTIQVLLNEEEEPPFDRQFAADVDGGGWTVVESDPPDVVVAVDGEAIGYLRITDPDSGELFDKVDVQSRRVESAALFPAAREILPAEGPWVLHAAGSRQVGVDLRSGRDERLADEGLALRGGEQLAWDAVAIDQSEAGTATVEAVTGGGARFELTAELVDSIDSIVPDGGDSAELEADKYGMFCFVPTSGGATVHGAAWTFRTEGDLAIDENQNEFFLGDNCPWVRAGGSGSGTLIAEAGGQSASIDVTVVPAGTTARSARHQGAVPATGSLPLTRGLRAAGRDAAE